MITSSENRIFYRLPNNIKFHVHSVISRVPIIVMASSINLFQFVQKCYQFIGVNPSQPNQKRRTIFLTCSVQVLLTTVAFLVVKANVLFEYGLGFFFFTSILNGIVIYLLIIWQFENFLAFIESAEKFIEKSK